MFDELFGVTFYAAHIRDPSHSLWKSQRGKNENEIDYNSEVNIVVLYEIIEWRILLLMSKLKGLISLLVWNILVNTVAKSPFIFAKLRYLIYKMAGLKTESSNIRSGCTFRGKSIVIEKGYLLIITFL